MAQVNFSGGKDSCVLKDISIKAGINATFVFCNTTNEAPELIKFIREYHKDVKWVRPEKPLIKAIIDKNILPTRIARWCCRTHKKNPLIKAGYKIDIVGVRGEESNKRKLGRMIGIRGGKKTGRILLSPIFNWNTADIWEYIDKFKIPYCSLYDEPNFERIGCVVCPLRSWNVQKFWIKRYPKIFRAFEKAVCKHFAKKPEYFKSRGCPNGHILFYRWLRGEKLLGEPNPTSGMLI